MLIIFIFLFILNLYEVCLLKGLFSITIAYALRAKNPEVKKYNETIIPEDPSIILCHPEQDEGSPP